MKKTTPQASPANLSLPFRCEKKVCERHVAELRRVIQIVHEAYHYDEPGTWETCSRRTCAETRSYLEETR